MEIILDLVRGRECNSKAFAGERERERERGRGIFLGYSIAIYSLKNFLLLI